VKILEDELQRKLLDQLSRGEDPAFNALYKAYSKPLFSINQLSPQCKKVFQLCKIEGKTHNNVAQQMGISISTVNSHMTNAVKSIREYILKNQDIAIVLMSAYMVSDIMR